MKRTFKKLILFSALALVMAFQLAIPVFAETGRSSWASGNYGYSLTMTSDDEVTQSQAIIPGTTFYHQYGSGNYASVTGPKYTTISHTDISSSVQSQVMELANSMKLAGSVTQIVSSGSTIGFNVLSTEKSGNYGLGYEYDYYPVTWEITRIMVMRASAKEGEQAELVPPVEKYETGKFNSGPYYYNETTKKEEYNTTSKLMCLPID